MNVLRPLTMATPKTPLTSGRTLLIAAGQARGRLLQGQPPPRETEKRLVSLWKGCPLHPLRAIGLV
jgi:hypothetical protein